jgi:hypothetical protein
MKVLVSLFMCISISITLLTGCENYNNGVTPPVTESSAVVPAETENPAAAHSKTENSATAPDTVNSATAPDTDQIADMSDWTPSTLDAVNNLEGVTMAAKEGKVSPTGLTLQFENKSGSDCIYGEYFLLEKNNNGVWHQVPVVIEGDYGFNSIGYSLTAGGDSEWVADWEWLYGSLDTGEYRVLKDILVLKGSGDYATFYLAAEFAIR